MIDEVIESVQVYALLHELMDHHVLLFGLTSQIESGNHQLTT